MDTRCHLVRLSLAAAAASLALAACQRAPESATATSASTDTTIASSTPPANSAAPGNAGVAGGGISPSTNAPGTLMENNPPAAIAPLPATPLADVDKTFALAAAEGGMFELEAAKLARDKASDPAIKDFAQKLIDDHGAANDKLRRIATSHDLALPATLPADKRRELDKLDKLSGPEFDKRFVQIVARKDHKADIALFEKASRDLRSEDLREFAKNTLPTLQQHLSNASKLPGHGKHG